MSSLPPAWRPVRPATSEAVQLGKPPVFYHRMLSMFYNALLTVLATVNAILIIVVFIFHVDKPSCALGMLICDTNHFARTPSLNRIAHTTKVTDSLSAHAHP
ncbi:hypothetical protein BDZ94DRAFT_1316460 [Collybia nuda]|uniref:Uncharacterized protein n=1 Tax=Collybia nuda TaxID=64659 RepID=A0A9P6C7V3_9AGAR|nr:hypothetical protein BDZ94DRAFT_1316460 [Collybia nuda]